MLPGANAVISRRREDRPVRPRRAAGGLDPAVGRSCCAASAASASRPAASSPCWSASAALALLAPPRGRRDDRRPAGLRRRRVHVGGRLVRLPAHLAPARPARLHRLAVPARRPRRSSSCGLIAGEVGDVHLAEWSTRSIFGLLYLITFGSLLAFTQLRLAAPERPDLEGLHLRVREPGRRDRARLADPRRGHHPDDPASARASSSPPSRSSSGPSHPVSDVREAGAVERADLAEAAAARITA